ncbi:unnamed protein product [Orchesella dallaii]|uniref:Hpc2-related domain-containing protein n=1 Tax=Orchesella dallaii TaxID=48710 RepID=A0ABP1PJ94_9HEXA
MSGSVAEALLASGSKKMPLLPAPPKVKKEPRTYTFNLALPESNDKTYPEFSWVELVRNDKQKEISKKAETGTPVLDPYASDDEEDLKAMAARFEAKYSNPVPVKKKTRRVEDYIDRGAGYDETDPFIDNSDVYDEIVPPDLQTVHGGFYINSGSLDFKEVELSEDDDSVPQTPLPKINKIKTKPVVVDKDGVVQKNPVGRPPGIKRPMLNEKGNLPKKRRIIITPVIPGGKLIKSAKVKVRNIPPTADGAQPQISNKLDGLKAPKVVNISSSSSSSSTSSEDTSSSSDSESSSSEENEAKKEAVKDVKNPVAAKIKLAGTSNVSMNQGLSVVRKVDPNMPSLVQQNPTQPKRLKTKNVPLNPKLHPNLAIPTGNAASPGISTASSMPQHPKMLNKDLIKANGTTSRSESPVTQSQSAIISIQNSSPALRTPTPKPVSTPSISPGVTVSISPTASLNPKPSSSIYTKPKMKGKPNSNNNVHGITTIDIFNSIASYNALPTLPNLNFAPNLLTPNSSLLKAGMNNSINASKAMPNLKKIANSSDKLVQKLPKQTTSASHKPVKPKPKQMPTTVPTSTFGGSNTSFLANLTNYKTPPPLAGPGVEISKQRSSSSPISNSVIKGISNSNASVSPSTLNLSSVSLAHSSSNDLASFVNAGLVSSIISSSATSLVNSVSSSLTMSAVHTRLPQSITITPSTHPAFPGADRNSIGASNLSVTKGSVMSPHIMEPKPTKHISAYDVQALLQSPSNYAGSLGAIGSTTMGSKSGAGKATSSIVSSRDMQRK